MTFRRPAAPLLLTALWLVIVAFGFALAVRGATEPPVWDALSYVQKAYAFWESLAAHKLVNPFNLPMTVRPPGTILMAYPFGWSADFRWFYFRSCVIPLVLFLSAVGIAATARPLSARGAWVAGALALVLGGMPTLYQFQRNDVVSSTVYWGLVDNFLAGVCALAAAALIRSVTQRSWLWALAAAAFGAFTLWVKPAGLLLMALVGAVWVIATLHNLGWKLTAARNDVALRRYLSVSLGGAIVLFAGTAYIAFRSEYFSAENILFGQRVIAFMQNEYNAPFDGAILFDLVRMSMGFVMPATILLGLVTALRSPNERGFGLSVLACLVGGIWFWIFKTEASQIRYFLPFAVMAYVLLVPALVRWAEGLPRKAFIGILGLAVLPTAIVTVFLLVQHIPDGVQRLAGVNLHISDFRAETEQANALLRDLKRNGRDTAIAYLTNTTPALRNIQAVWDYATVTRGDLPHVAALVPMDWLRSTTLHAEDMLHSDFLVAEAIPDLAKREQILAQHDVSDFADLSQLFNAWLPTLDESNGVRLVSETRVRLMQVVDPLRFEAALTKFEGAYDLPTAYRLANRQRWWSPEELAAREPANWLDAVYHATGVEAAQQLVRAAEVTQDVGGMQASFWIESQPGDSGPWFLFAHLIDDKGTIIANNQIKLLSAVSPVEGKSIRLYTLAYSSRPTGAVKIAFGFFRPAGKDLAFLTADSGTRDWENRRLILPLPPSQ